MRERLNARLYALVGSLPQVRSIRELGECRAREAADLAADLRKRSAELADAATQQLLLTDSLDRARADAADLAAELQKLTTERLILQDRLEGALGERAKLWEAMGEALAGERMAMHTQINILLQEKYGIAPHPDGAKLPDSRVPPMQDASVPILRRMTGSDAVRKATQQFVDELRGRIKQDAQAKS